MREGNWYFVMNGQYIDCKDFRVSYRGPVELLDEAHLLMEASCASFGDSKSSGKGDAELQS